MFKDKKESHFIESSSLKSKYKTWTPNNQFRFKLFVSIIFVICLSLSLILLNYVNSSFVGRFRVFILDSTNPIIRGINYPKDFITNIIRSMHTYLHLYQRVEDLEKENKELLKKQYFFNMLQDENFLLYQMLNVIPAEAPSFVTAKVQAYPSRPFMKSLLVHGGSRQGIYLDAPVMHLNGLVGRVIEAGSFASRVLLITDMNSRVPVYVSKTNVDGMVVGDNTEYPKLEYVEDPTVLQEGDLLVTSGKGGVFFRGIPVGYIKDILPHQIIIQPYVNLEELLFVTIQQK